MDLIGKRPIYIGYVYEYRDGYSSYISFITRDKKEAINRFQFLYETLSNNYEQDVEHDISITNDKKKNKLYGSAYYYDDCYCTDLKLVQLHTSHFYNGIDNIPDNCMENNFRMTENN